MSDQRRTNPNVEKQLAVFNSSFLCPEWSSILNTDLQTHEELSLLVLVSKFQQCFLVQSNEDGSADLNIDDFLGAPTCYLRCLHEHLRLVAAATPREHRDHAAVQRVVRGAARAPSVRAQET